MSTADVIGGLTAALRKLDEAHTKAAAAAEDAKQARVMAAGALQGAQAGPLLGILDQTREQLVRGAGLVPQAQLRLKETIQRTQALGNF